MLWIKYMTMFSSGYGEWEYSCLETKTDDKEKEKIYIKDFIRRIEEKYDWSEHFRRIEFKVLTDEEIPILILEKEYLSNKKVIEYHIELNNKLKEVLDKKMSLIKSVDDLK
jgi:hypothetical protein